MDSLSAHWGRGTWLTLGLCVLAGCQKEPSVTTAASKARESVPDANFELVVLNASQTQKSIDIQVHLDGRLVVDETFSSEAPASSPVMGIPPHQRFQFRLTPGTHTLKATSRAAGTSREARFDVTDKQWALVGYDYWSGGGTRPAPGQFEFQFQSTPIRFQ